MAVVFGNLTNTFGGLQPGAPGIATFPTKDAFNSRVSELALDFVYIGIAVMATMFIGSLSWTISGDRISRRIRGYILSASLSSSRVEDCICKPSCVRISHSSIDLAREKSRIASQMTLNSFAKEYQKRYAQSGSVEFIRIPSVSSPLHPSFLPSSSRLSNNGNSLSSCVVSFQLLWLYSASVAL